MKLKAHEVDGWVNKLKPEDAPALVLVYGPDRGGVHETAKALRLAYLGDAYDPLQYVALDESALAGRAGLLADEAAAMPMFGDHKLVHVNGGNAAVQAAVTFFLAKMDTGIAAIGAIDQNQCRCVFGLQLIDPAIDLMGLQLHSAISRDRLNTKRSAKACMARRAKLRLWVKSAAPLSLRVMLSLWRRTKLVLCPRPSPSPMRVISAPN